ncbi:phage tail protein [Streptomyces sp. XY431]|uniref:phage tail protein n=1 Tax=Streptomyces sp. XY431 TaxID=1415562 RepID=UPI0006AF80BB|nr:phage tail protein [Streptomyces sp. XY431]KOV25393.1 phage tail protein [Streptomyces sp. XY431]
MTITYTNPDYPIPAKRFVLDIDGDGVTDAAFDDVSGLTASEAMGPGGWIQMPGQPDIPQITLRKGAIPKDSPLFAWLLTVSENKVDKKDCRISLTDGSGSEPVVTWTLTDAFPVKLSGQNLDGSTGDGSIEEVVLWAKSLGIDYH